MQLWIQDGNHVRLPFPVSAGVRFTHKSMWIVTLLFWLELTCVCMILACSIICETLEMERFLLAYCKGKACHPNGHQNWNCRGSRKDSYCLFHLAFHCNSWKRCFSEWLSNQRYTQIWFQSMEATSWPLQCLHTVFLQLMTILIWICSFHMQHHLKMS